MKKIILLASISFLMVVTALKTQAETPSPTTLIGITISFSTHAYWDGESMSCLPRPHGWCLHIQIDAPVTVPQGVINGEISNPANAGLTLSFNRKTGIAPGMFATWFRDGKFWLDGPGTISGDVAKKLGLSPLYVIPEGYYTYKESGDLVTIIFRK